MRRVLAAGVKYVTNHVIAHIPSFAARHAWYRHILGWDIGPNAAILMGQYVQMAGARSSGRRVRVGRGTVINRGCFLYTTGGLVIGEHVSISAGTWLITGSHDIGAHDFATVFRPIVIEDHVWIGVRATILPGVTIGKGAVVTAGAVVTRDVDAYGIAAGVPASIIGTRGLRDPIYALDYRPLFE
jgi:acetyltransferase-like isoleucine patch superfamily enzyme